MAQKGTLIGEKTVTLKRHQGSYNDNNVYVQLPVSDIEGVETGDPVIIEMERTGDSELCLEFERNIHDSQKCFSIPHSLIEDNDIMPGFTFVFRLYEIEPEDDVQENNFIDDANVIDRPSAVKDDDDSVRRKLNSKKVVKWLQNQTHENGSLVYRNVRTGKEKTYSPAVYIYDKYKKYRFGFPKGVRESIDAEQGDIIEILPAKNREVSDMIEDMHGMMMEMYNAYLETKND